VKAFFDLSQLIKLQNLVTKGLIKYFDKMDFVNLI